LIWNKFGKRFPPVILSLLFRDASSLCSNIENLALWDRILSFSEFFVDNKNRPTTDIEMLTNTVEMALISGEITRRSCPSM
jgi:hypothetical protein